MNKNVYDGNAIELGLESVEEVANYTPDVVIMDRGGRGKTKIGETEIITPKILGKTASNYAKQKIRERFRRRAAIEPVIGHLKSDHRLNRNYLKGNIGSNINLLLACAAFNIKKYLRKVFFVLIQIFEKCLYFHTFKSLNFELSQNDFFRDDYIDVSFIINRL